MAGGLPGNSAILPLAGFIPEASVFLTTNPNNLNYDSGMLPYVSVLSAPTTYRSIRVTFVLKQALTLVGSTITLSATVANINGAGASPTSLTCDATPALTGVTYIGLTSTCTGNTPITLTEGGYIVLSATAMGLSYIHNVQVDAAVSLTP